MRDWVSSQPMGSGALPFSSSFFHLWWRWLLSAGEYQPEGGGSVREEGGGERAANGLLPPQIYYIYISEYIGGCLVRKHLANY
jgi:hypothetical protein